MFKFILEETMVLRIAIFTLFAFICEVRSQLCINPGVVPQIVATPGCATPQVYASPMVATTIIDNSVSNALANALQLLIVSELIDSKLGGPNLNNILLNSLGPLIEPIASIYPSILDVVPQVEYRTPYIAPLEVGIPQIGTIAPNYCGGIDTLYSNPYVTATVVPNYCSGISDLLLPNLISANNVISVNPYCGVTELIVTPQTLPNVYSLSDIIGPTCGINYGLTDLVSPNVYNPYSGVAELISALSPLNTGCSIADIIGSISPYQTGCCGGIGDVITPIPYNGCGSIEVINPIVPYPSGYGISDLITGNIFTPNYCGGIGEVISPTASSYRCFNGVPDVISPLSSFSPGCFSNVPDIISVNPFGSSNSFSDLIVPSQYTSYYPGVAEVISPITSSCLPAFTQNCFGGLNYPSGPIATEVFFPPTIPAQITCNYGFL